MISNKYFYKAQQLTFTSDEEDEHGITDIFLCSTLNLQFPFKIATGAQKNLFLIII